MKLANLNEQMGQETKFLVSEITKNPKAEKSNIQKVYEKLSTNF